MSQSSELRELRRKILEIANLASEGHIPSSLSVLEIIYAYYDCEVVWKSRTVSSKFILSKGHASLALFVVLNKFGYLRPNDLESYAKFESILGGHPDKLKVPGVIASTGSLGHGLPFGVGMALANKVNKSDEKIFILVGDGELNEGSNWEAMLLAAHHDLRNIRLIVDSNGNSERALSLPNLYEKLESFGFNVCTLNGHEIDEIKEWMNRSPDGKPGALIAETIKGHGFRLLENNPAWHHAFPSTEQMNDIIGTAR